MASILSFDSRSMKFLLEHPFVEQIDKKHPIFYKNKLLKHTKTGTKPRYFYRNSVEAAMKNNQVGAVDQILNYIIKN